MHRCFASPVGPIKVLLGKYQHDVRVLSEVMKAHIKIMRECLYIFIAVKITRLLAVR